MWEGPDSPGMLAGNHHLKACKLTGESALRGSVTRAKPCTEAAAATLIRCWVGSVLQQAQKVACEGCWRYPEVRMLTQSNDKAGGAFAGRPRVLIQR